MWAGACTIATTVIVPLASAATGFNTVSMITTMHIMLTMTRAATATITFASAASITFKCFLISQLPLILLLLCVLYGLEPEGWVNLFGA